MSAALACDHPAAAHWAAMARLHVDLPDKLRVREALDLYASFYRRPADAGELITIPSMADRCVWERLEEARLAFMGTVSSGAVAPRYLERESAPA